MAERLRLGILFNQNKNWIGGTYYIINLVQALNTLADDKKPEIIVLSRYDEDFNKVKATGFPYLKFKNPFNYKRSLFEALINKGFKLFTGKNSIDKRISHKTIDVLFPATFEEAFGRIHSKIFWFPDFQHVFYPEFFTENELEIRNTMVESIAKSNHLLVLSSHAANNDFNGIDISKNCEVNVIPFAVSHPDYSKENIEDIKQEYNIHLPYFIICNQFWKHKNHLTVFKAIHLLVQKGYRYQFIFTGSTDDYRNPTYFEELTQFINSNKLQDYICILGLVEREKQLCIMKYAEAVIQPSLFEGWSTVIEDAKAMNQYVIASDLDVHKEQLGSVAILFKQLDEDDLSAKIEKFMKSKPNIPEFNYEHKIEIFGKAFSDLLVKMVRS